MKDAPSEKSDQFLKYQTILTQAPIGDIEFNDNNPRDPEGKEDIEDLKESIRKLGVLVSLVAYKKAGSESKFVLLEGERRLRACKELYQETKNPRFSTVPLNVLQSQPDQFENLVTMFNMHTKRRPWNRAAEAEALGILRGIRPGDTSNTSKLAQLTGLRDITIEDELTYLNFPKDLRKLVLERRIGHYYLILLGRNLKVLEDTLPEVFARRNREEISRTLVGKALNHTIRRARDFNLLSFTAKLCIENEHEETFVRAFENLMSDPDFGIQDMNDQVRRELSYKVNAEFKIRCEEFRESLLAHLKERDYQVEPSIFSVLEQIRQLVSKSKKTGA